MLLLSSVFITWYHSLQTFVLEAYLPIPGTQNMKNQTIQTPQYRRLINQLQQIILLADHHIMVRNYPNIDILLTYFSFSRSNRFPILLKFIYCILFNNKTLLHLLLIRKYFCVSVSIVIMFFGFQGYL